MPNDDSAPHGAQSTAADATRVPTPHPSRKASNHRTSSYRQHDLTIREHTLDVPWDWFNDSGSDELTIYAREIVPSGGEDFPALVYLQGGPGHHCSRPIGARDLGGRFSVGGWIAEALKQYRVILIDQRGTGRSTPVDQYSLANLGTTAQQQAEYLQCLRADSIIADCEALREALEIERWTAYGQSFGGFCVLTYLSTAPQSLDAALLTGGLAGLTDIDTIYRATYAKTAVRCQQLYRQFPAVEQTVREVSAHLQQQPEYLPDGSLLTPVRLRGVGLDLGRGQGLYALRELFYEPFVTVGGQRRLSAQFLSQVAAAITFDGAPLYAVLHESIYGGAVPGLTGATDWSAQRLREELPGFSATADPQATSAPFYLTGEHIHREFFDHDPALRPFAEVAELLATKTDWTPLYDPQVLRENTVPTAAAAYVDDIFVPLELSLNTAQTVRGLQPWVTNSFHHNGVGEDGSGVFKRLLAEISAQQPA